MSKLMEQFQALESNRIEKEEMVNETYNVTGSNGSTVDIDGKFFTIVNGDNGISREEVSVVKPWNTDIARIRGAIGAPNFRMEHLEGVTGVKVKVLIEIYEGQDSNITTKDTLRFTFSDSAIKSLIKKSDNTPAQASLVQGDKLTELPV